MLHELLLSLKFIQVDAVLVIEDGFLATFLREDLPAEVIVARLPKSSGVVTRSADQWTRQRDARVSAYLHGENPFRRLHPHQITLKSSEVRSEFTSMPDNLVLSFFAFHIYVLTWSHHIF